MRPALFLIPLLVLAACAPAEKPAEVGTSAEVATMEAVASPLAVVASSGTCREDIGEAEAKKLVDRCIMMSPATHPPCNVDNSCQMIRDEITRSCAMLAPNEQIPEACAAF